ncbi:MAG: hypothetical protein ACOYJF_01815 [Prevotella sp.]|jgi:hypothetical protein
MKTKNMFKWLPMLLALFSFSACSDDDDYTIATEAIITTVETGEAEVTAVSATTAGRVLDLSNSSSSSYEVGTCYSVNQDPTTAGTKVAGTIDSLGNVTAELTGLTDGTTYYYCTYVTLQDRVTKYGDVKSFVATDAQIATAEATDISACKATLNASASGLEGLVEQGMDFGFKLSLDEATVTDGRDYALSSTQTTLSKQVEGLLPGNTYYYVAYCKLNDGLVYGDVKQFTTSAQTMEYVDLGLSVMWAQCNIGAETETETGVMTAYGDTTGLMTSTSLDDYTVTTDISGTDNDIVTKADIDGTSSIKSSMPTATQVKELLQNTTQTWETVDGVAGVRFTANNGNSIFMPAAGYRNDTTVEGNNVKGLYWSGTVNTVSDDYANTLSLSQSENIAGMSLRDMGLCVRSVRKAPVINPDNSKLVYGDIEGNGRLRIEIYNEYGASKSNPCIDPAQVSFSKNMVVKFKLSGVTGNLKDGAPSTFMAGLEYADASWDPSYWSSFNNYKYDCLVNGDGEYTVWMETNGTQADGAVVFCVDIDKLAANIEDMSKVSVEVSSIKFDVANIYQGVQSPLWTSKDGGGVDGRIELYNEYGETKSTNDYSSLTFNGSVIVTFTISGIDGNLVSGASGSYPASMSFADASWDPSYWGGTEGAGTTITGDGTYTVVAPLCGTSEGAVVWVIDITNLYKELSNPENVNVTINSIITPGV